MSGIGWQRYGGSPGPLADVLAGSNRTRVRAEFSLPLQVGMAGLGTLDLHRDEPGMLTEDELADALVATELVTDAMLMMRSAAQGADLFWLL